MPGHASGGGVDEDHEVARQAAEESYRASDDARRSRATTSTERGQARSTDILGFLRWARKHVGDKFPPANAIVPSLECGDDVRLAKVLSPFLYPVRDAGLIVY